MDETEALEAEDAVATPIFNVYRRGYDPDQVDRYVSDQQRRLDEAIHRASESERKLAAAVGQLRELHRRVAVYESEARNTQPPQLDTLGERVQRILQEAWEGAYNLRQEAEREVNDLRELAQKEVEALRQQANKDVEELRDVASREAAQVVDEATRRALHIRDETERRRQLYLERVEREREQAIAQITYLYDQRQAAVAELSRLQATVQATIEEMVHSPLGRPASGVADASAATVAAAAASNAAVATLVDLDDPTATGAADAGTIGGLGAQASGPSDEPAIGGSGGPSSSDRSAEHPAGQGRAGTRGRTKGGLFDAEALEESGGGAEAAAVEFEAAAAIDEPRPEVGIEAIALGSEEAPLDPVLGVGVVGAPPSIEGVDVETTIGGTAATEAAPEDRAAQADLPTGPMERIARPGDWTPALSTGGARPPSRAMPVADAEAGSEVSARRGTSARRETGSRTRRRPAHAEADDMERLMSEKSGRQVPSAAEAEAFGGAGRDDRGDRSGARSPARDTESLEGVQRRAPRRQEMPPSGRDEQANVEAARPSRHTGVYDAEAEGWT